MAERTCSIEDCERALKARGMCGKHYAYWIVHTPKDQRPLAPRYAREFWDFVEKTHEYGCWLWRGPLDVKGYGRWGHYLAHREAWKRVNGPFDRSWHVLHICDQHECVNPRHLYLGTNDQNMIDREVRARQVHEYKEFCKRGHKLASDNLYVQPSNGQRFCMECKRIRNREYYAREKNRTSAN